MQGRIGIFILFLIFGSSAIAQSYTVEGTMLDSSNRQPMIGVNIILTSFRDSTLKFYGVTNLDGKFTIKDVQQGGYRMYASSIGYNPYTRTVRVGENLKLGVLLMTEATVEVSGAEVVERLPPAKVKGDTTEYNSQAFKTNPDATAEDLVKKMPGVTVENGQVKAQGEDVKKVLVDGKEFFGDDPTLALRNLPADMIDKVQVFDRSSDQAAFTGVDDGNAAKTINIITRKDRREGVFGRVYGGYGDKDRYSSGLSLNFMKNSHRLSIVGLSNNTNQQNFAAEDLLGIASTGGGGGGNRGGGRGMMGGGAASNFMVGQQKGISTTHSFGINYSGSLSKKVTLTGSYFFNNSVTENTQLLNRTYFIGGDSAQLYNENSGSTADNYNHRANFRLEYNIDSSNSIVFTPRASVQVNNNENKFTGKTQLQSELLLSDLLNNTASKQNGYNVSSDLLFRHKFAKQGRTISANVTAGINERKGNNSLYSYNNYYSSIFSSQLLDQRGISNTSGHNISGRLVYTEPLSKKTMLQFSYSPEITYSKTSKETNNFDTATDAYSYPDTSLSNGFNSTYTTQRGGIDFSYNVNEGTGFSVELEYQRAELKAAQTFPVNNTISRPFSNFLPSASFRYKFSEKSNFRGRFRSSTSAPSVSQLQNLVNNSNPLLLSTGNPNLQQQYTRMLFGRLMFANPQKARNLFLMFMGQNIQDYIGTSTTIAANDTTVNGIALNRGSQLSMPVNLNGYYTVRSFLMYGLPAGFVKSNLNSSTGVVYSRTPSLINGRQNIAQSTSLTQGITLSSNVSKELDFTLSYSANYNIVKNSIRPELNNNFFFHTAGGKVNWIVWKGWFVNTEATQTLYSGLTGGFNQNFLLWNAAMGKKFLKNNAGELKLSVFDILNQNNAIGRTVTETYVEDTRTQVLNRYFMLTFTYTIKHFKKGSSTDIPEQKSDMPFMPPGGAPGMRPPQH